MAVCGAGSGCGRGRTFGSTHSGVLWRTALHTFLLEKTLLPVGHVTYTGQFQHASVGGDLMEGGWDSEEIAMASRPQSHPLSAENRFWQCIRTLLHPLYPLAPASFSCALPSHRVCLPGQPGMTAGFSKEAVSTPVLADGCASPTKAQKTKRQPSNTWPHFCHIFGLMVSVPGKTLFHSP